MKRIFTFCILLIGLYNTMAAQRIDNSIVQFSGLVLTEEDNELIPLPFTNILLQKSGRGTYSNLDGFFSIVARKGEKVIFSAVGFKTIEYIIPDTLSSNRYTIYQLIPRDTITLPETVVYPWPSREHFKIEFLALDIPEDLLDRARDNLAEATLEKLRETLPYDGRETSGFYLRRQAESYYAFGQTQPIHILNPLAWQKFFKAWKEGQFRRKSESNDR